MSEITGDKVTVGPRFLLPLALGSTLNPINSTMISVALVPIAHQFGTSAATTGWLVASLYLTSAIAQPAMGRFADLYGARRVYILSLLLVALAGLLGFFATSLAALIAVRVLLGIGTSGAYPSAMRLFHQRADLDQTVVPRKALGVLSFAAIATAALGPVLGGILIRWFGWHAIFTINLPLALFTLILVLAWLPRDGESAQRSGSLLAEVDLTGMLLFAVTLASLLLFIMRIQQPFWLALVAALAGGAALLWHSLRGKEPFIDVRMLAHNRPLLATYSRVAIFMMVCYCFPYGYTQWLQSSYGFDSSDAGLAMLPMSISAALASLLAARMKSIRTPFLIAGGAVLCGCVILSMLDKDSAIASVLVPSVLFGIPFGMISITTQAAIYLQAPAKDIATAAGFQRTVGYGGAIFAVALLGLMFGHRATDRGLHGLALVMAALTALILVATICDPTLRRR